MELVLTFADIDAAAVATVGGKAANLGEMTRAGPPVPPGVCVTTEAYRQVAAGAGLDGVFAELAATAPGDVACLTALAGKARAALLAAPVPPTVTAAVARAYATLGDAAPGDAAPG